MRLFGKVDGTVDRFDRAEWLTPPFDLAFNVAQPNLTRLCVRAVQHLAALGAEARHVPALGQSRTTHRPALGVDEIESECC